MNSAHRSTVTHPLEILFLERSRLHGSSALKAHGSLPASSVFHCLLLTGVVCACTPQVFEVVDEPVPASCNAGETPCRAGPLRRALGDCARPMLLHPLLAPAAHTPSHAQSRTQTMMGLQSSGGWVTRPGQPLSAATSARSVAESLGSGKQLRAQLMGHTSPQGLGSG